MYPHSPLYPLFQLPLDDLRIRLAITSCDELLQHCEMHARVASELQEDESDLWVCHYWLGKGAEKRGGSFLEVISLSN